MDKRLIGALVLACIGTFSSAEAEEAGMVWRQEFAARAGSGDFAPYYLSSNRGGIPGVSPSAVYLTEGLDKEIDGSKRFSFGFGAEVIAGYFTPIDYRQFDIATDAESQRAVHRRQPVVSQLWCGLKYRSLFLTLGIRDNSDRSLFNSPLSVGDYTLSDNALPVPSLRAGFFDFQNIPFTDGWVQIRGEIAYGRFIDDSSNRQRFNPVSSFITTDVWYHHKNLYLRTNPSQPVSVTAGMQHAAQFGGIHTDYWQGRPVATYKEHPSLADFAKVFLPGQGDGFYDGNHLGSWDIAAEWRIDDHSSLRATVQWPWEDGSGIGKLNGFDGIYGLEYRRYDSGCVLQAVMVQYVDFTNQSGPMHWAPGDFPGTQVNGNATGADDYYNNYFYDGWANFGMAMGTPFLKSPVYNLDGYLKFADTRVRGFQLGASGKVATFDYRLLFSYRNSLGTPYLPSLKKLHDTSACLDLAWIPFPAKPLTIKASLAFDSGSLYGDNFGLSIGAAYTIEVFKTKNTVL